MESECLQEVTHAPVPPSSCGSLLTLTLSYCCFTHGVILASPKGIGVHEPRFTVALGNWPKRENGEVGVRMEVRVNSDSVTEEASERDRNDPWGQIRMDLSFPSVRWELQDLGASCLTHGTPSSSPVSFTSFKVAVEVKQHFSRHSTVCGRYTLRKWGHISLVGSDGNLELRINNNPRISAGLPWIR